MHVCEGEDGCTGYPRKYLVQEMFGSIPETKPFTAYWCDDCRMQAEWLYGMSPGEERPYWWKMERCDVTTKFDRPVSQGILAIARGTRDLSTVMSHSFAVVGYP